MDLIDQIMAVLQSSPVLLDVIALCFGLIFGSFLNVVIYRLPVMMKRAWEREANEILGNETELDQEKFNLVVPRSRCPACGHAITALENIPVVSYLLLRARCAECGAHISARYPLIELLTGILTMIVFMRFGPTPAALACSLLTFGLIAASMIDYDHQLIPDDISLRL